MNKRLFWFAQPTFFSPPAKKARTAPFGSGDRESDFGEAVIGLAIPGKTVSHHPPRRLSDTEHTWRVAAKISGDYLCTDKTQIVSPIYGQRQALGRSARQPVPARTRHTHSRFSQHSCSRRSGEFRAANNWRKHDCK